MLGLRTVVRRTALTCCLAAAVSLGAPALAHAAGTNSTTGTTASAEPTGRVTAAAAFKPLQTGARGDRVRRVQRALKARGYRVVVNGKYGPLTTAAVRNFQRARKMPVTGRVGPRTWKALGLHKPDPAPTTSTTSTTLPADGYRHPNPLVERWHGLALEQGWSEANWKRLSCVIRIESGGNPRARNPSSAAGLLQIHYRSHQRWVGPDPAVLFDPATNLRYGLRLFKASGWRPWGNICG
ncbi:MAG: hypothetical protein RL219_1709 [Actinomycetota bacterium]